MFIVIVLAVDEYTSYDITPGESKKIHKREAKEGNPNDSTASTSLKAVCIDASDSAHSYFLGNKTKTEIESFFTTYYNDPSKFHGISVRTGCCVDGTCDGASGENCSTCAEDCEPCASPCTGTITDARDGKSYPYSFHIP